MLQALADAEKIKGIRPSLILSTAHMPESNPNFGGCTALEYEHGYIVFVVAPDCMMNMPDWLLPIMAYAFNRGCVLINFDCDEDTFDMFKEYDW